MAEIDKKMHRGRSRPLCKSLYIAKFSELRPRDPITLVMTPKSKSIQPALRADMSRGEERKELDSMRLYFESKYPNLVVKGMPGTMGPRRELWGMGMLGELPGMRGDESRENVCAEID